MKYARSHWKFENSGREYHPKGIKHPDVLGISNDGQFFVGAEGSEVKLHREGDPSSYSKGDELEWALTAVRLWLRYVDSAIVRTRYHLAQHEVLRVMLPEITRQVQALDEEFRWLGEQSVETFHPICLDLPNDDTDVPSEGP